MKPPIRIAYFLLIGGLFMLNMVLAEDNTRQQIPIALYPTVGGEFQPSTSFDYEFNFTSDLACNNVIHNASTTVTTDIYGRAFYEVDSSTMTDIPSYLCRYRDGVLESIDLLHTGYFTNGTVYKSNHSGVGVGGGAVWLDEDWLNQTIQAQGNITGSGTANTIPLFIDIDTIVNSNITENATAIKIGKDVVLTEETGVTGQSNILFEGNDGTNDVFGKIDFTWIEAFGTYLLTLTVNNGTDSFVTTFGYATGEPKWVVQGDVHPEADNTRDLGDTSFRFRDLYLGRNISNNTHTRSVNELLELQDTDTKLTSNGSYIDDDGTKIWAREDQLDTRYVQVAGDTMTGDLSFADGKYINTAEYVNYTAVMCTNGLSPTDPTYYGTQCFSAWPYNAASYANHLGAIWMPSEPSDLRYYYGYNDPASVDNHLFCTLAENENCRIEIPHSLNYRFTGPTYSLLSSNNKEWWSFAAGKPTSERKTARLQYNNSVSGAGQGGELWIGARSAKQVIFEKDDGTSQDVNITGKVFSTDWTDVPIPDLPNQDLNTTSSPSFSNVTSGIIIPYGQDVGFKNSTGDVQFIIDVNTTGGYLEFRSVE